MALANVALTDTFDIWRIRTNQIIVNLDAVETLGLSTSATSNSSYTVANAAFNKANAANVLAFNTGVGVNAYANVIGTSSNAWANSVGVRANTWANAVGTSANAYTVTVGAASNTWANSVGTSANAYAVTIGAASNTWANSVGVRANTWANAVGTSANAYAAVVGAAANTNAANASYLSTGTVATARLSGRYSITVDTADDANKLGGVSASDYITKTTSGTVLKVQSYSDNGSSTTSTSFTNANQATFSFTPVSATSTIHVIISFQGNITEAVNTNATGYVRLYEGATARGPELSYKASSSGADIGLTVPGATIVSLSNGSTAARGFTLYHRAGPAGFGATVTTSAIYCVIIEVQN